MNRPRPHTLGIVTTLIWEFWARSRRNILVAPLGALAFPGMLFIIVMAGNDHGPEAWSFTRSLLWQSVVYWPTILLLGSIILLNPGKPSVQYTLPVPSWLLVSVPIICVMAAMLVDYAIVAVILNLTFDVGWKILGPGLLAAVLIAWCHVVLWSTSNSVPLRSLAGLASIVAGSFAIAEWAPRLAMAWFLPHVGGWHVSSFALATLVCVGVGTAGFARLRHGSIIDFRPVIDWIRAWLRLMPVAVKAPFSSRQAAQFWLEWRERGWVLPAVIAVLGVGAIVLASWIPAKKIVGRPIVFAATVSSLVVPVLFLIGFFWGNRSPTFEFPAFKGSRPLSDRQIAAAVLKSVTFGLISTGLVWAAFMAVFVWIVAERQGRNAFYGPWHFGAAELVGRVALIALVVWSVVGFITSLSLAGKKAIGAAVGLLVGMWLAVILLHECLPYAYRAKVTDGYVSGCFGFCLLTCAAAFFLSWRLHLLSVPAVVLAVAIVLASLAGFHLAGERLELEPVLALCLLPIPLASAPLAVYVNRHR